MHHRLRERPVIDQQCREMIGGRGAHAVEMAERGISVPQEAQKRQHPVDGAQQGFRRVDAAAEEALAKGQQVEEQFYGEARVTAAMSAIGHDLSIEFARQNPRRPSQDRLDALAAQAGVAECHRGQQAGLRDAGAAKVAFEVAGCLAQGLEEGLVEGVVRPLEHQRRLAQEGDQPPRCDRRRPGEGGLTAPRDVIGDEGARIGTGERGVGRPEVAQPAEPVQRVGPFRRRRGVVEGRASIHRERAAGEDEQPGIDVVCESGIAGAQVVRRDHHPGDAGSCQDVRTSAEPRDAAAHRAQNFAPDEPI